MQKIDPPHRAELARKEEGSVRQAALPAGEDVAAYIAEMALQLASMARQARLERVGFLLVMASAEAQVSRMPQR